MTGKKSRMNSNICQIGLTITSYLSLSVKNIVSLTYFGHFCLDLFQTCREQGQANEFGQVHAICRHSFRQSLDIFVFRFSLFVFRFLLFVFRFLLFNHRSVSCCYCYLRT